MLNGDYGFTRLIFSFLVVSGAVRKPHLPGFGLSEDVEVSLYRAHVTVTNRHIQRRSSDEKNVVFDFLDATYCYDVLSTVYVCSRLYAMGVA